MAVVDGIHGRDVGQERLGGANVTGGLVSAYVLLSCLQTKAVGWVTLLVPAMVS